MVEEDFIFPNCCESMNVLMSEKAHSRTKSSHKRLGRGVMAIDLGSFND